MKTEYAELLKSKMDDASFEKIAAIEYAGNTVGLKKLSLRLAIRKADKEGDWLAEHMFIMRSNGPNGRKTYLAGAFPSACGKTATAMIPGENIVGDDLVYFRVIDGEFRAANVENGIFGIITDVNAEDDPVIFDVLTKPGQVIFGNVLVNDGKPYWIGMGEEIPGEGEEYTEQDYVDQFTIRIPELLTKHARMQEIYATIDDTPQTWKDEMGAEKARLEKLQAVKGDYISPFDL